MTGIGSVGTIMPAGSVAVPANSGFLLSGM